jgi:hypothetical protein
MVFMKFFLDTVECLWILAQIEQKQSASMLHFGRGRLQMRTHFRHSIQHLLKELRFSDGC